MKAYKVFVGENDFIIIGQKIGGVIYNGQTKERHCNHALPLNFLKTYNHIRNSEHHACPLCQAQTTMEEADCRDFSRSFAHALIAAPPEKRKAPDEDYPSKKGKEEAIPIEPVRYENVFSELPFEVLLMITENIDDPEAIVALYSTSEYMRQYFRKGSGKDVNQYANYIHMILFESTVGYVFKGYKNRKTREEREEELENMPIEQLQRMFKRNDEYSHGIIRDALQEEYDDEYHIDILYRFMGSITKERLAEIVIVNEKEITFKQHIMNTFDKVVSYQKPKALFGQPDRHCYFLYATIKDLDLFEKFIEDASELDNVSVEYFVCELKSYADSIYTFGIAAMLSKNYDLFLWMYRYAVKKENKHGRMAEKDLMFMTPRLVREPIYFELFGGVMESLTRENTIAIIGEEIILKTLSTKYLRTKNQEFFELAELYLEYHEFVLASRRWKKQVLETQFEGLISTVYKTISHITLGHTNKKLSLHGLKLTDILEKFVRKYLIAVRNSKQ